MLNFKEIKQANKKYSKSKFLKHFLGSLTEKKMLFTMMLSALVSISMAAPVRKIMQRWHTLVLIIT